MIDINYKIGDPVKIINYGHPIFINKKDKTYLYSHFPIIKENEDMKVIDINSGIIGKEGIISDISNNSGKKRYSIDFTGDKISWFDEEQLELINHAKTEVQ